MKFCSNCGAKIDDNSRFCPKCGKALSDISAGQAQGQTANAGPSPVNRTAQPGFAPDYSDTSTYSTASGRNLHYVVLQVTLKEKFLGTGSGNLSALEACINEQAAKGYRLHTIATATGNSTGFLGGDRIQATMVFEKII